MNQDIKLTCTKYDVELSINVEFEVESDGIGAYEFHGSRGFDEGRMYPMIEDFTFEFENEVQDILWELDVSEKVLRGFVSRWLEENYEAIEGKLTWEE